MGGPDRHGTRRRPRHRRAEAGTGPPDEVTLLAFAARDGNRAAFSTLVHRTQHDVWRLCAYLVDEASADDLTQETYLRAVTAISRYRGDASARTWLLSIARRVCIDVVRRRVRGRRVVQRLREPVAVDDRSGEIELGELLGSLDPDRRAAFTLTQLLGLRYDEAAEVIGCPKGTIRSRVSRARADLLAAVTADESPIDPTEPTGPTGPTGPAEPTGTTDDVPSGAAPIRS
jgi:RNA polymerase sigma-70 factor, ECF subfamily